MTHPIINLDQIQLAPCPPHNTAPGDAAQRFDGRTGQVAARIGARKLGYNITAVPPGKRAFPLHSHRVNEEMFFVIEGSGELRVGEATHAIRAGDVIACPPGGPETAHQIRNTGATEMRVLAVSTRMWPEIADYPDSGKFGVLSMSQGADGKPEVFRHMARPDSSLDYWDGE